MWIRTHEQFYPKVNTERIWQLWADINSWPKWHGDLDYCRLEGTFEVGNHFILKPTGGPKVKIDLIEINNGKSFTDRTNFFGAKMFDTHSLVEKKGGVLISNKLVVTGPLKWLWIKLVAKQVADTVPEETESLVKLARI